MNVSEAMVNRKSVRVFLDKPVSSETIATLLEKAARAPSGGNLQPWRVVVLNGSAVTRFQNYLASRDESEKAEYDNYPKSLKEPYRSSRYKVGEDMYALLDIPRDNKPARYAHIARNLKFFDAPAALFCFVDRQMGLPQWADLGMFLQSFMLLAQEAGLDTCSQGAWASRSKSVCEFVDAKPELMLFCGVAIGHQDPEAPVNRLESDREPLSVWARFIDE